MTEQTGVFMPLPHGSRTDPRELFGKSHLLFINILANSFDQEVRLIPNFSSLFNLLELCLIFLILIYCWGECFPLKDVREQEEPFISTRCMIWVQYVKTAATCFFIKFLLSAKLRQSATVQEIISKIRIVSFTKQPKRINPKMQLTKPTEVCSVAHSHITITIRGTSWPFNDRIVTVLFSMALKWLHTLRQHNNKIAKTLLAIKSIVVEWKNIRGKSYVKFL